MVLAKGVDFKGTGGYVVGPGSIHASGQIYQIETDASIAPIPEALRQLCKTANRLKEITEGHRHSYLMRCAGGMASDGLSYNESCANLRERRRHCAQGEREITDTELQGMAQYAAHAKITQM